MKDRFQYNMLYNQYLNLHYIHYSRYDNLHKPKDWVL